VSLALREVWSVAASGGDEEPLLAAGGFVLGPDEKWRLTAWDAGSGARAWTYPVRARAQAVHDGTLVAGASRQDLHVIDVRTGRPIGCLPHPWPSAMVSAGSLLVVLKASGHANPGLLTAMNAASGRRLWTYRPPPTPSLVFQRQRLRLAASAEAVVLSHGDGHVVALDSDSGAPRWRRSWPRPGRGAEDSEARRVFLREDDVIAEAGTHVVSVTLGDGRLRWEAEGEAHVLRDGLLYAVVGADYVVRRAHDGKTALKRPLSADAPAGVAPVAADAPTITLVTETHAFVSSRSGRLVALQRDTGRYAWHHAPAGWGATFETLAAYGRLYYRNGPRLYCLAPD
jgi:outer membrane protein assembly factor BamB